MMDRFAPEPRDRSQDSAAGYDLAPTARSLNLPGEAVVRMNPALALDVLAADLLAQAMTCVRQFGDFHLAIGGDSSIETLYLRLMSDTELRALPWDRTHLWMTHERRLKDEEHRAGTALREFIIDHSDIPRSQAHLIPIDESDAPDQYEAALRETLGWRERGHDRLDCVVVAIEPSGEAGGRTLIDDRDDEGERLCDWASPRNGAPPTLALTRRFVRASRLIAVMGFGAERRAALRSAATNRDRLSIRPVAGELRWYLDEAIVGDE